MRTEFTITIVGYGKSIEECWNDAFEGFMLEPGDVPTENYFIDEEDE